MEHAFDPYDQVARAPGRAQAVGHPTDKVELLILGGTWSAYRRDYQEWFVLRCFDALNGVESTTLAEAQARQRNSLHRNVGLVIETRPDHVMLRRVGLAALSGCDQGSDGRAKPG